MNPEHAETLKDKLDPASLAKLEALDNDKLHAFVVDAITLCKPASVTVCCDDPADIAMIRQAAIDKGEEAPLAREGHTVHFDGYKDQARDKAATKYLVPEGMSLGRALNATDRDEGLAEVRGILDGMMEGKQMFVRFFCLGPVESPFSISCVQITDSAYVCHSEDLLYRPGYEQFKRLGGDGGFFRLLHSAGRLEGNVCADVDKRRIYIDINEDMVYSSNTQYAGNTVGLKKLSLRLAIRKASREGWLAEHMFVMASHGADGKKTYLAGAFPSACGKTSTAMVPGESIVGDDIAYFRVIDGQFRAANVEAGIFGIIGDVNPKDDPVIYDVLTNPGQVIFSNVLITDGVPSWLGMGSEIPAEGVNHSGPWTAGKVDAAGNAVTPSHKNARYTVSLNDLSNLDEGQNDPNGVPVGGVVYGGRDSDTCVPVQQSFDWAHGIITMGGSLESETTAATLGAEGVRTFCMMSNQDFIAIPLGQYIQNNLDFVADCTAVPPIFGVNYFLKGADGQFLNGKLDKSVWIKWMGLRVNGQADAIEGPTGMLPCYDDLAKLFKDVLGKDYTQGEYVEQFTTRIPENLAKLDRVEAVYRDIEDAPASVFEAFDAQRQRLTALRAAKGDYVSPLDL